MPTYTFLCDKCKFEDEEIRLISKRNEPKKCSRCNNKMDRLIGSGSGIVFKGSGFYETDYKRNRDAKKELIDIKKEMKNND